MRRGPECTARPLVGVLSQPGLMQIDGVPANYSYIAASYVKFVEMAGARAVPIPYDAPADEITRIFQQVNGVLLPGGVQDLTPTHRTSYYASAVCSPLRRNPKP